MRRFGAIVFSLAMLYAGVAWALEGCLRGLSGADHEENQITVSHSADLPLGSTLQGLLIKGLPRPHCPDSSYQIGPMAAPSLGRQLSPFADGILSKAFLSLESVSSGAKRELWLRTPFKRFLALPLQGGPSLHLFLSLLLI